ncbi:hypothetical protein B0H15DRAFT_816210 [Mycena belliarum]|uniref:DUF1212-domain-containing protein n=1 Tax=Mycena belliarum TaxID=1033014 RepID=A0AAD6Y0T0_9AGAR|nr:hypothetical protein B0H15DRAFT_816210 [Mycena belliae]
MSEQQPKTPPAGIMSASASGRDSPRGGAGSRTPRRVQWMDTHEEGPEDSTHALDEHGIDPNAFETLKTALERHSSNTAAPRVHYFPPRAPEAALPRINTKVSPLAEHNVHSATTTVSSASLPPSPTAAHTVPGAYIGPEEDAGLPGAADDESAARAAGRVVRAHTRKGLFTGFRKRKAARPDADEEKDLAAAEPMNPSFARSGGGGVLSALLTLYNEGENTGGTGSLASTPGEELPEPHWPAIPPAARRPFFDERRAFSDEDKTRRQFFDEDKTTPPSPPSRPHDELGRSHARAGSTASLASLFHLPPKQRAGGGVIGALIASTANISGAAAPVPSQLAPNIKRPGYHLSRYSVDEEEPESAPAPTRERPKSLPPAWTLPASSTLDTLASKRGWTEKLRGLEQATFGVRSGRSTPVPSASSTTDREEWIDERWMREQEARREKRRKRRKAEVYITRHVAQIIQRQEFILKLTRALMMFGGPSHRLQAQIMSTGRVLDIQVNCMYLPDVVLISFDDASTGTSNLKFIRQGSALNLAKLNAVYALYWSVIHDEQSVSDASGALDALMRKKQEYSWWQLVLIGGMCSSSICTVSFGGSFLDAVIVFPLGALLVAIQLLSVRNELYSNVFEITIATLISFLAAALASTGVFCFAAVASSAVVLILPGFIVLGGALELLSRNIVSGSVRLCYAVVYSLFLGFGLAMGAEAFEKMTGHAIVGSTDYTCSVSHNPAGPWYQRTPSLYWAFLTVPMFPLFLSMRNHAPWRAREMLLVVGIACIGWVTNHFTGTKFPGQSDVSAAVGAFAVGVVANVYARFFSGNAFVIMITGILFQVPSGLGNGGLLTYASQKTAGAATSYLAGFQTALQLVSVAIGLTVGLGLALALVHPIQSRRRAGGVFSL